MDYKGLKDELLYQIVKSRVPEIPVERVDKSNRNMVIAVLQVTERITERRHASARRPKGYS